jgi:hypothetical protein
MPRLSLWRENHSNDFKFFDRRISEMFTIGGTGFYVHKYLGTQNQTTAYPVTANAAIGSQMLEFGNVSVFEVGQTVSGIGIDSGTVIRGVDVVGNTITLSTTVTSNISSGDPVAIYWTDATKPYTPNASELNIQDLLFLENRDRKYDTSVYSMRGIYQVSDNDFDLQQFGLFLNTDTVFVTFHLADMVATLGRKIMSGDVIEMLHKKDYYPIDAAVPAVLKRYYVVQDCSFAAEGFSQTWWPHLWRCKLTPMVDSQEYKDILNNISAGDANNTPIGQILSTYNKLNEINDAIIAQAQIDVPKSGYNTAPLYVEPDAIDGRPVDTFGDLTDTTADTTDGTLSTTDNAPYTPQEDIPAYLGGDGLAPNGWPVTSGTSFPANPLNGDYVLRLDFLPNRLFRFDGRRWVKIEDAVRTDLTPGANNLTQLSGFVNNTSTYHTSDGKTHDGRQSLSKALTPKADN